MYFCYLEKHTVSGASEQKNGNPYASFAGKQDIRRSIAGKTKIRINESENDETGGRCIKKELAIPSFLGSQRKSNNTPTYS